MSTGSVSVWFKKFLEITDIPTFLRKIETFNQFQYETV